MGSSGSPIHDLGIIFERPRTKGANRGPVPVVRTKDDAGEMSGGRTTPGSAVVEGVGRVPGFVNSYIYTDGEETYLIDTGFARKAPAIVRAFRNAHVPISRVGKLLLTHHHPDHRGGAAYLLQNIPAPVACHSDDIPYVNGTTRAPMPWFMRLLVRTHPAPVAIPLTDGDRVGPLLVVHVPGHTPGEVAFYDPARKILFSGDSVVEKRGALELPAPRFASDRDQAVRSLSRLRALDVEVLLPGHGVPVSKDVRSLIEDLIRRATTDPAPPRPS
jgi:glyoxylase-like metal-dependent hydrolase (beta-lactamase superfamily II)